MPADPNTLEYRRSPRRSLGTWLLLWLVWCVGLIVWALYVVVPNYRVRRRHGLIGSLFATVMFEIAKRGFVYFVTHFANYKAIYGAVAALPVFLIWIYLSWTIILAGAVLTATLPEWRRPQAVRQWRRKRPL